MVMRRACRVVAATVLLLGLGRGAGATGPNVLLVSIDSLRADRTSLGGNPRETTPTLDRLAAAGVAFLEAYSPTSWTLPAHATLLTGLRQAHHGVVTPSDRLGAGSDGLATIFQGHGYETVGVYSGPFLHPTFGFGRGFDRYESCEPDDDRDPTDPAAWEASHTAETGRCVVRVVSRWARRRSARPFFAFLHLFDVHYDYVPPGRFPLLFDRGYTGPLDGTDIMGAGFPLDASARDVQHLLALYDAEIRWTDSVLARLLTVLRRRGLLRDTLVVVTADHGDEFLEHGGKGHQHSLYTELVHVPLVFWAPDRLPAGRRVEAPVSLADVAPTVLAIAGLERPEPADGFDLTPVIDGVASRRLPARSALYQPDSGRLIEVALHDGSHGYVGKMRRDVLVPRDPGGNVLVDDPALAPRARRWARLAAVRRLPTSVEADARHALPAAVTARLEALGYLDRH
jgi:choline-sulfatase